MNEQLRVERRESRVRRIGILVAAMLSTAPLRAQTPEPEPLTLRRAAELALARSPELASARAQAEEAAAGVRAAAAMFAPQAFATTTPGYSSGLPVAVAGRVPAVFGVELHKTLYDPLRRAEVFQSRARAAAVEAASAQSSTTALRALVISYGRTWADQQLIESARRTLEAREAIFRRESALAREGRRTELVVDQAGFEVARAKQALADRQAEYDLDRLELARLVGWTNERPLAVAEDPLSALPAPPPGDHLAAARAVDPELAALAQEAEALERAALLQKRAWLPVIQAEGQYLRLSNYNNFDQYFVKFKSNDWAIGVSVAVPLWTGGRLGHGEAAATARLEKARADRRVRDRDVELAVRRAEADAARYDGERKLATRSLSVARDGLRVAQALANEGRGEGNDVDARELDVSRAQIDLAQAEQGLLAARARLFELRGELSSSLVGK